MARELSKNRAVCVLFILIGAGKRGTPCYPNLCGSWSQVSGWDNKGHPFCRMTGEEGRNVGACGGRGGKKRIQLVRRARVRRMMLYVFFLHDWKVHFFGDVWQRLTVVWIFFWKPPNKKPCKNAQPCTWHSAGMIWVSGWVVCTARELMPWIDYSSGGQWIRTWFQKLLLTFV